MTGIATGPTEALLSLGEARPTDASKWLDYRADVGLTDEHISELTRVACDPVLNGAETDSKEVWAPVHAWRALGQLRAAAAVEPLLRYLARVEDDDSVSVDFPLVFGMIGYPALRPLIAFATAQRRHTYKCATATDSIKEIAAQNPEHRGECIDFLTGLLGSRNRFDPDLNGFIVADLLDLRAVEAIDAIREAFERDAVEPSIAGDLEDVEIDLGLREARATPAPRFPLFGKLEESWPAPEKSVKIGRNDPCPCGSGKKHKKCCLV